MLKKFKQIYLLHQAIPISKRVHLLLFCIQPLLFNLKSAMGRHKIWRRELKKQRRKIKRQQDAKNRSLEQDKIENSPRYQAWLKEHNEAEEALGLEEDEESGRRNAQWLQDELLAQQEFKLRQLEKEKQNAEILRQKAELIKEIEAREEKKRLKQKEKDDRKKQIQEQEALREQKIEDFLQQGCALPDELRICIESNPSKPPCPFYQKVAACRFGDACSRNHTRPSISCVLLIPSMFSHPSLQMPVGSKSGDQEWFLEFADSEIENEYSEFFKDACAEVEKLGTITRFFTCCNREAHLRGNVYIQLANERDALRACRNLSGRWFGGKRLQPCFVDIVNWKNAICGLFSSGKCPKGQHCNFMHIFPNPGRIYMYSPRRTSSRRKRSHSPASMRSSNRRRSGSQSRSSKSKRQRSSKSPSTNTRRSRRDRDWSPENTNLALSTRDRSLSPWSPGRRLTRDTPPKG